MGEYISKDDFCEAQGCVRGGWKTCKTCFLLNVPDADVVPVIHSEWLINCDGYYPYCKNCGNEPDHGKMNKYCAFCGAKMDGVK